MRQVLSVLAVAVGVSVSVSFPARAEPPSAGPEGNAPAAAPAGPGAAVAPSGDHTLAQVHGGLTAQSATLAGRSRDVQMSATEGTAAKPARPVPTPRVLRRMSSDRVIASINATARGCATESTAPAPTTISLRVSVAPGGEVESAEPTARVTPALLACVTKSLNGARFGAPGPSGALIVVPVTVPARPASTPVAADPTTPATPAPPATQAATDARPEEAK